MLQLKTTKKGFTLIELLIVIAIIATLAAISIPIGMRVYNNALAASATSAMKQFTAATNAYYRDHGVISHGFAFTADSAMSSPAEPANGIEAKATEEHDVFIAGLTGEGVGTMNSITYLKMQEAKSADTPDVADGITTNAAGIAHGMLDPWGNPYYLQADTSYENQVTIAAGTGVHAGKKVRLGSLHYLVICSGKDGVLGTEDDIMSNK